MSAIDRIFEILTNGDWHDVAEVAERMGTQETKIEMVSSFLSAYSFLEYDKKTKRMKLSTEMKGFIEKIKKAEQKEALGKRTRSS